MYNSGDSLTEVTTAPSPYDEGIFYIKLPDITLGGVIPVNNFPIDDPETQYEYFYMYWNDTDPWENTWNAGETITWAELESEIEGLIDINRYLDYYVEHLETFNPEAYYTDPLYIRNYVFENFLADIADYTALRIALEELNDFDIWGGPIIFIKGNSLYLGVIDAELVWNSLTAEGTEYPPEGDPEYISTGSFWWALTDNIGRVEPEPPGMD